MVASTLPLGMIVALLVGGGLGMPLGLPPLPPDPIILRAAPEQCLFYMSWAGTAKPDAQSGNQTEQLLAEDEVVDFLQQLDKQISGTIQQSAKGKPEAEALAAVVPGLLKTLFMRPAALYVADIKPADVPDVSAALVVNCGDEAERVRADLLKLEVVLLKNVPGGTVSEQEISGVKFRALPVPAQPTVRWGMKKTYLLVTVGDSATKDLLAQLSQKGKQPPWLEAASAGKPVERVSTTSYFNVAGALAIARPMITDPQLQAMLDLSGVSNLKSLTGVTGLDGQGIVSQTEWKFDGPPRGLFAAAASAKPLTAADLAGIPQDCTLALAARIDLAALWRCLLDGFGTLDPQARRRFEGEWQEAEAGLGFSLQNDLLASLGDVLKIYNASSDGGPALNNIILNVSLRDHKKLVAVQEIALKRVRERLKEMGEPAPFKLQYFATRDQTIYYIEPTEPLPITPAWCLTKDQLIVSVNLEAIKSALARPAGVPGLAENERVAQRLKLGPSKFAYIDMRAPIQGIYGLVQTYGPLAAQQLAAAGIPFALPPLPAIEVVLPHITPTITQVRRTEAGILVERWQSVPLGGNEATTMPVAMAVLLPAVQAAREAARRTQEFNNLKMIALAMHNHHDVYKGFPTAAISDKQGKPLLSWRVKLLPYLEEKVLYDQFHRDEPWDSEHNRALIANMPDIYADPEHPQLAQAGKTRVLVPVGDNTMFSGTAPMPIAKITDGTSRTIMGVEAAPDRAVIWTKPDDLKVDLRKPLDGLKGARRGGFAAIFADGSVRLLSDSIDAKVLSALFTPSGGETEQPPD